MQADQPDPAGSGQFDNTDWFMVARAGDGQAPNSSEALEKLCGLYWHPLYVYARCRGRDPEEAQDLTQEFFARLVQKQWLRTADQHRGRFRTFLLAAMAHLLANVWDHGRAEKRGGGQAPMALDALSAEERSPLEPRDPSNPAAQCDRRWAITLIVRAEDRLKAEMEAAGEGARFAALEPSLAGERQALGYRDLAARFSVTENTIKSWVLRLRRRLRALVLDEAARALGPGHDPEAELHDLLAALAA